MSEDIEPTDTHNAHNAWVSDEEIAALNQETKTFGHGGPNGEGETIKQFLQRLFEENSPAAALSLIKLSLNASSENVRMQAAKHILERVMGPAGEGDNSKDPAKGSLEYTLNEIEKGIRQEHGDG